MFALKARPLCPPCRLRLYSSAPKASIKLVAELRKLTSVSLSKARDALEATNNSVPAALDWLKADLASASSSSAAKLAKIAGRTTNEGLVGVSVLQRGAPGGIRAAMVELNCETDFVARNALFGQLLDDVAHTAAYLVEPDWSPTLLEPFPLDVLLNAPLLSRSRAADAPVEAGPTVEGALRELSVKVGEKLALRRAVTTVKDGPLPQHRHIALRVAAYAHGAVHPNLSLQGRVATLALLGFKSPRLPVLLKDSAFQDELEKFEKSMARQIVGFPTTQIRVEEETGEEGRPEEGSVLYEQPFMMMPGSNGASVKQFIAEWEKARGLVQPEDEDAGGVEVLQFAKWTVGEPMEEVEA